MDNFHADPLAALPEFDPDLNDPEAVAAIVRLQQQNVAAEQQILQLQQQNAAMQNEILAQRQNLGNAGRRQAHAEGEFPTAQIVPLINIIQKFNGNPTKLHSFIEAVERVLPLIEQHRNQITYPAWLQAIRSKIVDDADNVLELYGTSVEWEDIKRNLITHYSDRRDEVSLINDLNMLKQTGTVHEFYNNIMHTISLLINLLNISRASEETKASKRTLYHDTGLRVFVRGLHNPVGPIIRAQRPANLVEALRLYVEEENNCYGRQENRNSNYLQPSLPPKPLKIQTPNPFLPKPRHIPPQQPMFNSNRLPQQHPFPNYNRPLQQYFNVVNRPQQIPPNPFNQPPPFAQFNHRPPYPQNGHPNPFNRWGQGPNPNPFNQRPFERNAFAPRPVQMARPVPMDVDQSIRSNKINYINRNSRPNFGNRGPHFQFQEVYPHDHYEWQYCEPEYQDEQYGSYDTYYGEAANYDPYSTYTENNPQHESSSTLEIKSESENLESNDDLNFRQDLEQQDKS